MKKLMLGFVFIFLDFNLNLNEVSINLLPSFVGYILLYMGLGEMMKEVPRYGKIRIFCSVMVAVDFITWICNLLGLATMLEDVLVSVAGAEALYLLITLAMTVVSYYISYQIVMGIADIEKKNEYSLGAGRLEKVWLIMVVSHLIASASSVFGIWGGDVMLVVMLPFLLVMLVTVICFLVYFNRTKNEYYKMKDTKAREETLSEYLISQTENEDPV